MRYRMLVLILALSVGTWAQTATSNANPTPQSPAASEKSKCPCCDKMAASNGKDAGSCCARHSKDAKDMAASCHDGKCDGKSCMKDSKGKACGPDCKDKMAQSCCKDCGKDGGTCCSAKS